MHLGNPGNRQNLDGLPNQASLEVTNLVLVIYVDLTQKLSTKPGWCKQEQHVFSERFQMDVFSLTEVSKWEEICLKVPGFDSQAGHPLFLLCLARL